VVSASATPLHGRFAVGTAVAGPGEKGFGHIRVPLPDGEHVDVACWVIQGRAGRGQAHAAGPVLYVHSTQHGNEISGVEVVRRVATAIDPRRLRGTVIAVPVANPLAFHWRRHHYLQGPEEAYQGRPELDVDHFWPGDPEGTHVQRLAHALWHQAVQHATHVLDMHTWNRWQAAATTVRARHAPSLALARAFGLWVQARPEPAAGDEGPTGSITGIAIRHGKAACAPNFTGQWDIYEPEVRRGVAGLRNVLRHLGMLPGPPLQAGAQDAAAGGAGAGTAGSAGSAGTDRHTAPGAPFGRTRDGIYAAPPVFSVEDLVDVRAPTAGLFLPRVRPEDHVRQGQPLGVLVGFDDFREQPVAASVDALVHLVGAVGPGCDVALPPMMPIAAAGARVARLLPIV
jgi:predicted deacylase